VTLWPQINIIYVFFWSFNLMLVKLKELAAHVEYVVLERL
jgi:hypothetical protein